MYQIVIWLDSRMSGKIEYGRIARCMAIFNTDTNLVDKILDIRH